MATLLPARPARPARAARPVWRSPAGQLTALALVVALATLALAPSAVLGYDALLHVVWGRELASGSWGGYERSTAITPHPLQLLLAVLVAPLGGAAADAFRVVHLLALGALAAGVVELGRRLASWRVGALAAALLLVQPYVLDPAHRGQADVPALALLAWAAALEAERPRRGAPVLVLLALAGLLRPEAWLLSGAYGLWLLSGGPQRRPLVPVLLLVPAGPVLWALTDLALAGDPLWSFRFTSALTEDLQRPTGLENVLPVGLEDLLLLLGPVPLVLGAAGLVLAPRLGAGRTGVPVALVGLGALAFLVLAAARLSLQPRYLLPLALGLVVLAALAVEEALARRRALGTAVLLALAVGVLAGWPVLRGALALLDADDRSAARVVQDPRFTAALAGCRPVVVATAYLVPHVALALDVPAREVALAPAPRGLHLVPSPTGRTSVGGGAAGLERESVPPPPDAVPVLETEHWRVLRDC